MKSILFISDLHAPYHHPDTLSFLKAVKAKYKPDTVISVGDEVDMSAMSFHDSDVDLPSAGDELKAASSFLRQLEKLFPTMTIVDSNHGSMAIRRFKHHGIPMKFLKTMNEVYGVGKGWKWVNDLTLILPDKSKLYVCHGMVKDGRKFVMQRGQSIVQGHFHTDFRIDFISTPERLMFSLQVGCLIDKKSLAFAYDKLNLSRPILGVGLVINSQPLLVPMVLDNKGRWNKSL